MSQNLIRYSQLRAKGIPWSLTHVSRLEKAGKFPRCIHLGTGTLVWVEAEVDAFVAAKLAQREAA